MTNRNFRGQLLGLVIAGNDPRLATLLAATEDEYFGLPYLNTLFGEVK